MSDQFANTPNPLLRAVDNHNIASNESWFSGTALIAAPLGTVAEGAAQLWNSTVVPVANMIGGQGTLERQRSAEWLRGIDDSLGNWVEQNQEAINITGFIAGSLVPGTLAVKGLRGLQALRGAEQGIVGTNLAASMGTMPGMQARLFSEAAELIAKQDAPLKLFDAAKLKAMSSGAGRQFLEAAAFETAVIVTMNASPILDQMDAVDLAKNLAMGVALGGIVGTAFDAVKVNGLLNKVAKEVDSINDPFKRVENVVGVGAPAQVRAAGYMVERLRELPEAASERQIALRDKRMATIDLELKKSLRELAGGDEDAAQIMFESLVSGIKTDQQALEFFAGLRQVRRVGAEFVEDISDVNFFPQQLEPTQLVKILTGEEPALGRLLGTVEETGASKSADGFRLLRPIEDLNIGSWFHEGLGETFSLERKFPNKDAAFAAGMDVYLNRNKTLSINPNSTKLERVDNRVAQRKPASIVEVATGNTFETAVPTLADKSRNVEVREYSVITDTEAFSTNLPFSKMLNTVDAALNKLTSEAAQARTIWAIEAKLEELVPGSVVGAYDIPLLERILRQNLSGVSIRNADGSLTLAPVSQLGEQIGTVNLPLGGTAGFPGNNSLAMVELLAARKGELADAMLAKGIDEREIALRINSSVDWIYNRGREGLIRWDAEAPPAGMRESEKALWKPSYKLPAHLALDYNVEGFGARQNLVALAKGELDIVTFNKMYTEAAKNVTAPYLGPEFTALLKDPPKGLLAPNRLGAGGTGLAFGAADVGSMAEFVGFVGLQVQRLTEKKLSELGTRLSSPAQHFIHEANGKESAELGMFMELARRNPEAYTLHPTKENTVVTVGLAQQIKRQMRDPRAIIDYVPEKDLPAELTLSPKVINFLKTHSEINRERQMHFNNIKGLSGRGREMSIDDDLILYVPPINVRDYKHFAFVIPKDGFNLDQSVIVAPDANTLRQMIEQIPKEMKAVTKAELEANKEFYDQFEYRLAMNDGFVDSELKRKGVFSRYTPQTDGRVIMDEFQAWHAQQEKYLVREMVNAHYGELTTTLRHYAEQYASAENSQFGGVGRKLEQTLDNPYLDYLKVMMNISRRAEYGAWNTANGVVQKAIEAPFDALRKMYKSINPEQPNDIAAINYYAKEMGLGTPFQDAASALLANTARDKPWLPQAISRIQGILSGTVLGLDFIQAVNTFVSAPIMYSSELRTLMRQVFDNPQAKAAFEEANSLRVPGQPEIPPLPTMWKIIFKAHENYHADARTKERALLTRYQSNGAIPDPTELQRERAMIDNLSSILKPETTLKEAKGLLESAEVIARSTVEKVEAGIAKGRRITGNDFAEQYTRFIAADVARQVGEYALAAGVTSVKDVDALILNFVNRVHGTFQASQRPMVFQGVIGQTVALWQTYTFNMLQRLLTNVGEGQAKSAAMLLGLQGSIYGMQGLPGFNFVNTHIVGQTYGNTTHQDLYSGVYGAAGKEAGDWLVYGLGSNALGLFSDAAKFNLYTRGDINPRQWTILPNPANPMQLPIFSITGKFLSGVYQGMKDVENGAGLWNSFTRAVEHASINRPLAGLAQVIQGRTTTAQGSLLAANDLVSISSAIRVLGAKPFDESIALDALYRTNAYVAADLNKLKNLGSAIKTSMGSGGVPTEDQMHKFMLDYASSGGRIENFNRFMASQFKNATTSQVNIVRDQMHKPIAQNLLEIMGGERLPDFVLQPLPPTQ